MGKYDVRDYKEATYALLTNSSNMKQPTGPSTIISNASKQHFTEKFLFSTFYPSKAKLISCNINEPKQCMST